MPIIEYDDIISRRAHPMLQRLEQGSPAHYRRLIGATREVYWQVTRNAEAMRSSFIGQ